MPVVLNINYLKVIKKTLTTLCKKKVHIGAQNVELFNAQHASYLLYQEIHLITCGQKQPRNNSYIG